MSRLGVPTVLVVLALAFPVLAGRRHAVGFPSSPCAWEVLVRNVASNTVAIDGELLYYFDDETREIWRMPKRGGAKQLLATAEAFPVLMAFDADRLYFATLSEADLKAKVWSIPRSGGLPALLADEVIFPRDLKTDATHVYWSSYGTPDDEGMLNEDGRIERVQKDGSGRIILAAELAFPSEIVIDDTWVYFGEVGSEDDDTGGGLQRVPKGGGAVEVILPETPIFTLAADRDAFYFQSFQFPELFVLQRLVKSAGARETLYSGVFFAIDLHPVEGKLVYYHAGSDDEGIAEIDLATRAFRYIVPNADAASNLAVDGCAVYFSTTFFGTTEPQLFRAPR